jgi:hypothetical protein
MATLPAPTKQNANKVQFFLKVFASGFYKLVCDSLLGSIGGVCLDTVQCLVDSSTCEGADGAKKCTCPDKNVPSTDNKKCLLGNTTTHIKILQTIYICKYLSTF